MQPHYMTMAAKVDAQQAANLATLGSLAIRFEEFEDEHGHFDRVESQIGCPELHAFTLLSEIAAPPQKMIAGLNGMRNAVLLNADCIALANNATDEQIQELVRCGVCYEPGYQKLAIDL